MKLWAVYKKIAEIRLTVLEISYFKFRMKNFIPLNIFFLILRPNLNFTVKFIFLKKSR